MDHLKIGSFGLPLNSKISLLASLTIFAIGCGGSGSNAIANKYLKSNLVASLGGVASHTDPNLVNAWGISSSPAGPFWVSNNGTGVSGVYGGDGTVNALVVNIPGAGGGASGPVTGQVYNATSDFVVGVLGPSKFIFATEDGVISAWYSGTSAVLESDRSGTGAVYKGLAIGVDGVNNRLYAANFNSGAVDVFDATFAKISSFTDATMPVGFAPFGIQNINGLLYVTYAKQNPAKHDDVPGAGNGYVDVFNMNGTLNKRLVSTGLLNSPWGLAMAPSGYGKVSNALLVGNFGDGKINAYDSTSGALVATMNTTAGTPLVIDGLWGLSFGNGAGAGPTSTLFFSAGPNGESTGLFGSLTFAP